jgi:hypothetical protein
MGLSIKEGNNVAGGRGQHSREIKLKESECEEGHIALRVKQSIEMHTTIYGLNFASCFCNLLARVYKTRPRCSWGSVFGWESTELLPAC